MTYSSTTVIGEEGGRGGNGGYIPEDVEILEEIPIRIRYGKGIYELKVIGSMYVDSVCEGGAFTPPVKYGGNAGR